LDDRITARLRASDYRDWRAKVTAIGGCAQPVRLTGSWQLQHATTGALLDWHGGDVMAPCGNRRESVCPACSDRYAADAYHLMHAGLSGGSKGIPSSVTGKPRLFATVTAPSFGAV
ncbi:replication initiation protein, partial [Saccharothrix sp. MB29]|nr:replication initiation protein [Saccharothrix sp. MB29]